MRHTVHALEVVGQSLALRRREHVADVCEELHNALRGLVGQLHVFNASSLQRSAVNGRLCQRLHGIARAPRAIGRAGAAGR